MSSQTVTMSVEEITEALETMVADPTMKTIDMYSPQASDQPGGRMTFVERHLTYLRTHKLVNPIGYLSNLALIIKIR